MLQLQKHYVIAVSVKDAGHQDAGTLSQVYSTVILGHDDEF